MGGRHVHYHFPRSKLHPDRLMIDSNNQQFISLYQLLPKSLVQLLSYQPFFKSLTESWSVEPLLSNKLLVWNTVREMIRSPMDELWICSFLSYKMPEIVFLSSFKTSSHVHPPVRESKISSTLWNPENSSEATCAAAFLANFLGTILEFPKQLGKM